MKKENSLVDSNSKNNMVLGLNIDGEIVQFDKECQRITGYTRTEAFNKKIRDLLIPTPYVTKWMELFDSAVKNEDIIRSRDASRCFVVWRISRRDGKGTRYIIHNTGFF